jgi:hypothetical protein
MFIEVYYLCMYILAKRGKKSWVDSSKFLFQEFFSETQTPGVEFMDLHSSIT